MTMGYLGVVQWNSQEVLYAKDVNLDLSASDVDKTNRSHGGWRGRRTGLKQWGVNFVMESESGDSVHAAMLADWVASTTRTCSAADGDGNTVSGNAWIQTFNRSEPLDGVITTNVTIIGDGPPSIS